MDHVQVVVSDHFIPLVVSAVAKLIRFNRQNRTTNELSVVDTPPVCTIAMAGVEWCIMDKPFEIGVVLGCFGDSIANPDFLGVLVNFGRPRVRREDTLETRCAVAIKVFFAAARVNPVDTVGTSMAPFVGYAKVCGALGALVATVRMLATTATFVGYAKVCASSCALVATIRVLTTTATFVGFAKGCASLGALVATIRMLTTTATFVGYAKICASYCALVATIRMLTTTAAFVGYAKVCASYCALVATIRMLTTTAAFVGYAEVCAALGCLCTLVYCTRCTRPMGVAVLALFNTRLVTTWLLTR